MNIVCLDMEGVLVPEMWVAFAEKVGLPELKITTKDEPDYDKLMKFRLNVLSENGYGLKEIQDVISTMEPMEGAKEFLDELRKLAQVVIVSDTFEQFAAPLIAKLNYPSIYCNSLVVEDGKIVDYKMRCEKSKVTTVTHLQGMGFDTIAAGDSYNDIGMIQLSKAGFLFKSSDKIKGEYPDIRAIDEYDELLEAIKANLD
ncbi:MAG: bifunctional phosphoserine phosphatase/homoserine phosphotransferase ThrH [Clostridia bacterium]|nr:bifunctional phosphoserine phosphatase/homoserine phosphotransferase ThrH [Clostridia bacterium]